jgi:hypothetical protein
LPEDKFCGRSSRNGLQCADVSNYILTIFDLRSISRTICKGRGWWWQCRTGRACESIRNRENRKYKKSNRHTFHCKHPLKKCRATSNRKLARYSPDDAGLTGTISVFWTVRKPGAPFSTWLPCFPCRELPKTPNWPDFPDTWTHSSRRHVALHRPGLYAGAGRGRSPSISRRISPNNSFGTATSAIWKVT